jgi:hypothetical protein
MPADVKPPDQDSAVDAVLRTADKVEGRLERYLKIGERYGYVPLALGLIYFQFLIPLRDGNLEHVKGSIEAQKETAAAVQEMSGSTEAIKEVVEQLSTARAATDDRATAHFTLTKEIGANVEAIGVDLGEVKAAVMPRRPTSSGTPPRPYSAAGS